MVRIAGSSVGPSTPQFHDRPLLSPSRLSSPFASLCFWLYETRSVNVKPSCAATKLMLASGDRPPPRYRSELPVTRDANSPIEPSAPRQKSRTPSRYLPFHSFQMTGKFPTR